MDRADSQLREIYIIGPQPPPYHGAAKNTHRIAEQLAKSGWTVKSLNTAPHDPTLRGAAYHVARARRFLRAMSALHRPRTAYIVPDGGLGILYTLLFCVRLRASKAQVILHHRNYSHITKWSRSMAAIVKHIAPSALHVFLDATMGRRFSKRYEVELDQLVVSNAALNDVRPAESGGDVSERASCVGFLSAISLDKGFDTAVKAFDLAASVDPSLVFHVAGALAGSAETSLLAELQVRHPDRVVYWGEINGKRKDDFFRSVGIFVFPTRYKKEAQPNVVFEAMASGCYVISSDIACIPEMLSGVPSALVDNSTDAFKELAQYIAFAKASYGEITHRQIVDAYLAQQEVAVRDLNVFVRSLADRAPRTKC